ncbi:MAG: nuclear transport factor 2 family protein [Gaiellaceae bacterium]
MKRYAILTVAAVLAGCGGHSSRSAEDTARAWSAALNRSDNETAASLFASNAEIIQNGEIVLQTHRDAVRWNAGLPCGGRITRVIRQRKDQVLVVFRLIERPGHHCDAPGIPAAAVFRVEHGKIVLWRQTNPPAESRAPAGEGPAI